MSVEAHKVGMKPSDKSVPFCQFISQLQRNRDGQMNSQKKNSSHETGPCAFRDWKRVVPVEDGCVVPLGEKPWEIIRLNQNYHKV